MSQKGFEEFLTQLFADPDESAQSYLFPKTPSPIRGVRILDSGGDIARDNVTDFTWQHGQSAETVFTHDGGSKNARCCWNVLSAAEPVSEVLCDGPFEDAYNCFKKSRTCECPPRGLAKVELASGWYVEANAPEDVSVRL